MVVHCECSVIPQGVGRCVLKHGSDVSGGGFGCVAVGTAIGMDVLAVAGGVADEFGEGDRFQSIDVHAGIVGLWDGLEEVEVWIGRIVVDVAVDEVGAVATAVPIHHRIVADCEIGAFAVAFSDESHFFKPVGELDGFHPCSVVIADYEVLFAIET